MTYLIHALISFASSVGFGIITNIPRRTLLPAGITGAASWLVYVALTAATHAVILPNLMAGVTIGVLANLFAIRVKAPVNVMYIPSLVSLVPGAIIYMSMKDFTLGREAAAQQGLTKTLTIAIALAVGFVIAEASFNALRRLARRRPQN
ncbi:threonine/serine exporter family protein [Lacticaseibacillus kribbianus]|uniref:threonine/serine exporter family protein n=1 Tax=Lacticaseibacillus kribbianus TaxID=2926292 RepID=UPI001CD359D4|nr:threonine/serine exporter family protein [Lacticaseibacillus kribbianus]